MAFAPELDTPVFTEVVAKPAPVVIPVKEIAPEATRTEVLSPAIIAAPLVEPTPEPVVVAEVAAPEPEPVVVVVEAAPARIIWYVTGSQVNVREGPSTDYTILGSVIYGDAAEIISDPDADWVKIRIEGDGVEGYIAKRFMAVQDPLG